MTQKIKTEKTNYMQVGRTIKCGACDNRFEHCDNITSKYPTLGKCKCICHDKVDQDRFNSTPDKPYCNNLDCPERHSICCGRWGEAVWREDKIIGFICSGCKNKFVSGVCPKYIENQGTLPYMPGIKLEVDTLQGDWGHHCIAIGNNVQENESYVMNISGVRRKLSPKEFETVSKTIKEIYLQEKARAYEQGQKDPNYSVSVWKEVGDRRGYFDYFSKEPHKTVEGGEYCCACEFDVCVMNDKIKQEKSRVVDSVKDLLFNCYPPDMENFSTMTEDQAYRLLKKFWDKLENYEK